MIAFGCAITALENYGHYAARGIALASERDSVVFAQAAAGSVPRRNNLLLAHAARLDGLEALVLLHQDARIVDPAFSEKLRQALADTDVGVVGCVGAVGAPTIAWWEGSVTWAAFARCYRDYGAEAPVPELGWNGELVPPHAPLGEVDTLDGFMLGLSPWAVRNLRFDEALDMFFGWDFDFCLQVRAEGRKVVATDIDVVHSQPLDLVTDPEAWIEAHMLVSEKWEGRLPHLPPDERHWRERARVSEAEAGMARLARASTELLFDAAAEHRARTLGAVTGTRSWRLTEPLRRLNARRRRDPGA